MLRTKHTTDTPPTAPSTNSATRPRTPRPTVGADALAFSERDLDAQGILSRKTRWRLRRECKFPLPRTIGSRILYDAAEVRSWLTNPAAWAEQQHAPVTTTKPTARHARARH